MTARTLLQACRVFVVAGILLMTGVGQGVLAAPNTQDDANVIALEMWRVSFGGGRDEGLGSALAVILFALVIPAMAFNVRRFRRENT